VHNKLKYPKNKIFILSIVFVIIFAAACSSSSPQSFDYNTVSKDIDITRAMNTVQDLVDISPRLAGLESEAAAGEYVYNEFVGLGYEAQKETFPMTTFKLNKFSFEVIVGKDKNIMAANVLSFSASTPQQGLANIPLVFAQKGLRHEVGSINMRDSIAVIHRGDATFQEKVANCAVQGALGVIIIHTDDAPLQGSLGQPASIPAIGVSLSIGNEILDMIHSQTGASANLLVDTTMEDGESANIIALKKSEKASAKTLIIGAHYDSVDCPGANDNASGTAALMEIARVLKNVKLPFNIKFIAFGAEEVGLKGSIYHANTHYGTQASRQNIIGMINMDMVATGEGLQILRENQNSVDTLHILAQQSARILNIAFEDQWSGRSDHAPFEQSGIPVVFLQYGPVSPNLYHTEKDNMDIIDSDKLNNTIKVVLNLISRMQ